LNLKHTNKPNLLILTSSFPRSSDDDTCGYVREFARSLCPDYIVSILAPPDPDADDFRYDDMTVLRSWSPFPSRREPFAGSKDLNRLASGPIVAQLSLGISILCYLARALTVARSAAVICCHWMVPCGLIGLLCSVLFRRPLFIVEHSGALHLLRRSRAGVWIARLLVSRSKRLFVVSTDLNLKLKAIAPEMAGKIEVIPMGVDCRYYSPGLASAVAIAPSRESGPLPGSPESAGFLRRSNDRTSSVVDEEGVGKGLFKVLFIGRLTSIKGVDLLLRAAAEVPDIDLTICGDGEARESLEKLGKSLAVEAHFTGRVGRARKRELLQDCDCVVVPSTVLHGGRTEGLPLVCLEAMAAAKAVVAARSGGLTDVIIDGDNGLLFEPGDHQMLATRLRELRERPLLLRSLGARAASAVSGYDWLLIGDRFRRSIGGAL